MALKELTLFLVVTCFSSATALKFSAFNVKWLTPSEYNKAYVADSLPKIIRLFDITLIQELRGDGENVMSRIAADLEVLTGETYSYVLSDKIGRTSYKEQYAYIWRISAGFSVRNVLQYPDELDVFEREPYMIKISSESLSLKEFVIIGMHIKPAKVKEEMDYLIEVYDYAVKHLKTENILFAGDMNADCTYLKSADKANLKLVTDPRFNWLISDTADTTVSTTNCAYDRFIASGAVTAAVVPGSPKVYDFKAALGLAQDVAYDVSDHYPICLELL